MFSESERENRHALDGLGVSHRHFQGVWDQFGSHVSTMRSQQFFSSRRSRHGSQIHESFPGVNVGDVTRRHPIQDVCCEVPFDQVRLSRQIGRWHGGAGLGVGLTRY